MSRWRARRFAALLAFGMLGALLAPALALGHAELASSTPAPSSTLKQAPTILVLTFTEAIDPANSSLGLLDENGQSVPGVGTPDIGDGGRRLTAGLPTISPGVYEVSYRVTSAIDGHVTSGVFAFRFDPSGTLPPPAGGATTASPSVDPGIIAARWAALVLLLVGLGITLFWLVAARPSLAESPAEDAAELTETVARLVWRMLLVIGLGALCALTAFLWLSAAAIGAADGRAGGGFSLDPAAAFGWTPFAIAMRAAWLGSLGIAAVAAARLLATRRARMVHRQAMAFEAWFGVAALATSMLALGGLSFAGHAAAEGGPLFAAVDTLHLLGVAAWLGTLGGLALLALGTRHLGTARGPLLGSALARHSRIALLAAPAVGLTGLANSPVVLGEAREVVASDYGNLVVAKALLFSAALAIGSANFFLIRRRSLRQVALLVGGEAALGLAAVAVAATMLTIQPGASRVPQLSQSAIQTAHVFVTAGSSQIHAAIDIPSPGEQLYQVAVADQHGLPRTDLQRILLDFVPPADSGLAVRRVALTPTVDPTIWAAQGAYTPALGEWTIRVVVQRVGSAEDTTTFPLLVQTPIPAQLVPPPDTGIGVPAPLAVLWLLPDGVAGWLLPVVPLLVALALWLSGTRLRRRTPRLVGAVRVARAVLVVIAVVLGLGIGSRAAVEAANRPTANAANPLPASAASIARGRLIYLANCSSCHGTDGAGGGPQAAGMLPAPGAIGSTVAGLEDGQLQSLVTNGVAGTAMPAFATRLSENDRWDLVNYLHDRWPQAK